MNTLIMDMGADVKGESTLEGFGGTMELVSVNHGVLMQVSTDIGAGDRTADRPNHQDLSVIKYLDAASPVLNQFCCAGKVFPEVKIIIGRNDGGRLTEYLRYTLKNVIVSSIAFSAGRDDRPAEVVSLNYNHITWKYTKPDGGAQKVVEGKWDVVRNRAL